MQNKVAFGVFVVFLICWFVNLWITIELGRSLEQKNKGDTGVDETKITKITQTIKTYKIVFSVIVLLQLFVFLIFCKQFFSMRKFVIVGFILSCIAILNIVLVCLEKTFFLVIFFDVCNFVL
jgi:predicted secreted protein